MHHSTLSSVDFFMHHTGLTSSAVEAMHEDPCLTNRSKVGVLPEKKSREKKGRRKKERKIKRKIKGKKERMVIIDWWVLKGS